MNVPPLVEVQLLPTRIREIKRDPLNFMLCHQQRYGDFIHYPLRVADVFQATHPAIIQHVLQTHNRNYSKDTVQYNTLSRITGRGLLTSDGRAWLQQRRLVQPAFHRTRLEGMAGVMLEATQAMLQRWEARARAGEAIDVDEEMMQLTLEIVGQTLFSIDLRTAAHELTQAVLTTLDYVVYRAGAFIAPPLNWPTRRNRGVRAALRLLERTIYTTIADRRASGADTGDVLSMLLHARDPETGESMSDAQIRDQVMTLLIAGHETVASALTWSWRLLAAHPETRARLEAELDAALGGRLPAVADLPALPYTHAVFEETLRLYPPAWLITRRAEEADQIGEAAIPARALFILSPYVTQRHPDFWPNPLRFDPARFLDGAGPPARFAYIPFGGGPRLCIGDQFALLEARLILASVAQRFRLHLLPGHPVQVDALVTLRPRHGLLMTLETR
jgi:cytochrome P450